MMAKLTETKIQQLMLQWLNSQPDIVAFKVNTVGIFDPVKKIYRKNKNPFVPIGGSDIWGACRGHFFVFEVKTPTAMKSKLPPDQIAFIEKVRKKGGGIGHFVSDLQQVMDHIELIRRNH